MRDALERYLRREPSVKCRWVWYDDDVSPTVFREGGYRFYFFSREEPRIHVHVHHETGEAKIWLELTIEVAQNYGLSERRLATALRLIEEHENEIRTAWEAHFER